MQIRNRKRVFQERPILVWIETKRRFEAAGFDNTGKVIHPMSAADEQEYNARILTKPLARR